MDPSQHYLFPTKLDITKRKKINIVIHLSLGNTKDRVQAKIMEL